MLGVSRTTAFHLAGKVEGRRVSRASTIPNLRTLRQVVSAIEVSADYLLGYDVPVDRAARSPMGSLARHLHDALRTNAPEDAPLGLVGDVSDRDDNAGWASAVVNEMVAAWWEQKRARLAQSYSDALTRLADRLDHDSRGVSDPAVSALMGVQAIEHRQTATVLSSPSGTWRHIVRLHPSPLLAQVPRPTLRVQRLNNEVTIAFFEATVYALGGDAGVGVAWRASEKHDEAWFIDGRTLKIRHKKTGRFLTPLTLGERLARPGTGN